MKRMNYKVNGLGIMKRMKRNESDYKTITLHFAFTTLHNLFNLITGNNLREIDTS